MHPQMQRLYQAAQELKNVTGQSAVAKLLGATAQTVHNWEQRGMSKQGMVTAQRVIGCSASWLETGTGQMSINTMGNVVSAPVGSRRIPLISYVQAGLWKGVVEPYKAAADYEFLLTDMQLSDGAFALEIKGDSMLPEFDPGDRVIIDPAIAPQPGDFVVAKNGDEEATFKKYRLRGLNEKGQMVVELVPLNQNYPSIRSDNTEITIVGTMVEHRKYRRRA